MEWHEANTDSRPEILSWRIHPKNDLPMPKYDTLAINRASFNTWYFCLTSSVLSCSAGLLNGSYHHISVFALLYIACTRVYCLKKNQLQIYIEKQQTAHLTHTQTHSPPESVMLGMMDERLSAMQWVFPSPYQLICKLKRKISYQKNTSPSLPLPSPAPWHAGVPVKKD